MQLCKECSRTGQNSELFLQPTFLGTETQQVETYLGPQYPEQISKDREIQVETPETLRTSRQPGDWVISIDFKDFYFHSPIQTSLGIPMFSHSRSILPIQSTTIWSVHSAHGFHSGGEGGETNGLHKNPAVPRQLVGQIQIPPNLSPAYTTLVAVCQELG